MKVPFARISKAAFAFLRLPSDHPQTITATDFSVLAFLGGEVDFASLEGKVQAGLIAMELGIDARSVRRSRDRLNASGLVSWRGSWVAINPEATPQGGPHSPKRTAQSGLRSPKRTAQSETDRTVRTVGSAGRTVQSDSRTEESDPSLDQSFSRYSPEEDARTREDEPATQPEPPPRPPSTSTQPIHDKSPVGDVVPPLCSWLREHGEYTRTVDYLAEEWRRAYYTHDACGGHLRTLLARTTEDGGTLHESFVATVGKAQTKKENGEKYSAAWFAADWVEHHNGQTEERAPAPAARKPAIRDLEIGRNDYEPEEVEPKRPQALSVDSLCAGILDAMREHITSATDIGAAVVHQRLTGIGASLDDDARLRLEFFDELAAREARFSETLVTAALRRLGVPVYGFTWQGEADPLGGWIETGAPELVRDEVA